MTLQEAQTRLTFCESDERIEAILDLHRDGLSLSDTHKLLALHTESRRPRAAHHSRPLRLEAKRPKVKPLEEESIGERTAVTIARAQTLVSVSRRTIYNWINAGKVEYVRTAGGAVRIFVDTLFRPGTAADFSPLGSAQERHP